MNLGSDGMIALVGALVQSKIIADIPIKSLGDYETKHWKETKIESETNECLNEIYCTFYKEDESFLQAKYKVCFQFIAFFSLAILLVRWLLCSFLLAWCIDSYGVKIAWN